MFVEVMSLLVLGLGDVSGKDVVHLHGTTGHLDHSVVDGLVGVLEGLQESVLQSQESTGSFRGFISSSDIDEEAHVDASGEGLALGEDGKSVVKVCYIVRGCLVTCVERLVAL